jgi:hypothetical protein
LYFHQNVYTAGGDKMVFLNTPPGGRPRLCTFEFKTRGVEVVADAPAGAGGFGGLIVGPKRREAFYRAGQVVYATHLGHEEDSHGGRASGGLDARRRVRPHADETLLAGSFVEGKADVPRGLRKES